MFRILIILAAMFGAGRAFGAIAMVPDTLDNHTIEALTVKSDLIVTAVFEKNAHDQLWLASVQASKAEAPVDAGGLLNAHFYEWALEPPKAGTRVLAFLRRYSEGRATQYSLTDYVCLDDDALRRPARDFSLRKVTRGREVLDAVLAQVQRPAAEIVVLHVFPFPLNHVVDDDRLLPSARLWVDAPDPQARYLAVRVFEKHRDAQDAPALRRLLNDPYYVDDPLGLSPWSAHEFLIRQAAAKELTARGVAFGLPELAIERGDVYAPVAAWRILAVCALPMLGVALFRWHHRRRRRLPRPRLRRSLAIYVCVVCAQISVLSALAWWRSETVADNLVWARGGLLVDVISARGNLCGEIAHSWPDATGWAYLALPRPESSGGQMSFRLTRGLLARLYSDEVWLFGAVTDSAAPTTRFDRPGRESKAPSLKIIVAYPYVIAMALTFPLLWAINAGARRLGRKRLTPVTHP